ncbi:hypothetical protein [Nitrincola alkalilacustris]|uniref:hypothetical protein n=1 Tax=Nitrincola alkalilacustris TaxID=1571224 RepID=UPI00124C5154|nr:hypothetical protein [Nitrincola alkalilacustris]
MTIQYNIIPLTLMTLLLSGCTSTLQTAGKGSDTGSINLPWSSPVFCAMPEEGLSLNDSPCNLLAWQSFAHKTLQMSDEARQKMLSELPDSDLGRAKAALLHSHPDSPYQIRQQNQWVLMEMASTLPPDLADYFRWLLRHQQQLLETEQAVHTLTRLNTQHQQSISQLEKEIAEKKTQIEALTEIESRLNASSTEELRDGQQ